MGSSENNKLNDGTGFAPTEPSPCANGCGFFGTAATMGLCSKCYQDARVEEETAASARAALEKLVTSESPETETVEEKEKEEEMEKEREEEKRPVMGKRCGSCNKKVGVLGFLCRCGCTFCGVHRYPEKHGCTFDFRGKGKDDIAKANPVVKADKIDRI